MKITPGLVAGIGAALAKHGLEIVGVSVDRRNGETRIISIPRREEKKRLNEINPDDPLDKEF